MSQTHWNAVLLGGCRGTDGLFDFSRPVLLEPAVQHILRGLPTEWNRVYLHAEAEQEPMPESRLCPEEAGLTQRLASADLPDGQGVMLLARPVPTWTREDYCRMAGEAQRARHGAMLIRDSHGITIGAVFAAGLLPEWLGQDDCSLEQLAKAAKAEEITDADRAVTSAKLAHRAQSVLRDRVTDRLMEQGVTILDPAGTWIAADVSIGAGSCILPGSMLYPGCTVGEHSTIGPNTVLKRACIGDHTEVNASQVLESTIGAEATVGPFAYIRPGCTVGDRTKIGDFVELKNATIGDDTKASHLTYIGDAAVGQRVNFGCGTVVVNYDGYAKYRTEIGDDCFLGCNTNLVAPVQLGDRVLTAAGSTVTEDVPDGAMAIARARQQIKRNWNEERIAAHRPDKKTE
ncbi:MAG: DapH/DapD/GlmU-related protein [Eubacteriales bacterium]|nr:DapH/DapD/GlmU-related protein [Eubacteriales bacterium]